MRFHRWESLRHLFWYQRRYQIQEQDRGRGSRAHRHALSADSDGSTADDYKVSRPSLFISETVLKCNKARWKAFTYHVRKNCFTSSVAVSAAVVLERGMRPCKYCVPDATTGESIVTTRRKIVVQSMPVRRKPNLPNVKFGDQAPKRKRRKTSFVETPNDAVLVPQVKLTLAEPLHRDSELSQPDSAVTTCSMAYVRRKSTDQRGQEADPGHYDLYGELSGSENASDTNPSSPLEDDYIPWFNTFSPRPFSPSADSVGPTCLTDLASNYWNTEGGI
jgi:hypothetical protein